MLLPARLIPRCSGPGLQAMASGGAEVRTAAQVSEDLFCQSKRKGKRLKADATPSCTVLMLCLTGTQPLLCGSQHVS